LKGSDAFGDVGKKIGCLEFEIVFVDGDHGTISLKFVMVGEK
jgi:hypothetical protein